jgi:hypothetical protein
MRFAVREDLASDLQAANVHKQLQLEHKDGDERIKAWIVAVREMVRLLQNVRAMNWFNDKLELSRSTSRS